jgi:hypothetical protein
VCDDGGQTVAAALPRVGNGGGVVAVDFNGEKTERGKQLREVRQQLYLAAKVVRLELVGVDNDGKVS